MNQIVEELASRKAFDELDAAERAAVLDEVSREAYEQLRAVLHAAPALDPGPGPSPELRARLLAHAGARPPGLAQRQIPAWQAAAAVVLAMAAVWLLRAPATPEVVREVAVPVVQWRTDTLVREQIRWKNRVVFREKVVFRDSPPAPAPALPPPEPAVAQLPAGALLEPVAGTSLGAEPALIDFFVQVR